MIAVRNKKKIKDKDRWNYYHNMLILPLLGANHFTPLLHISKRLIWLNETKKRINEFDIEYMINPSLHVNKSFR